MPSTAVYALPASPFATIPASAMQRPLTASLPATPYSAASAPGSMPITAGTMTTASLAMTAPAPRPLAMPASMSMVPTMHGMPATTFALSAAMYAAAPPTAMAAPIAGRLPVPVPMPVVYQHYPPYASVMHAATASARLPAPRGPAFPVDITSAMASSNFLSALDPVPVPAMPAGTNAVAATVYAPRAPASMTAAVPSPVVRRPTSAIPSPVVTASMPSLPAPASTLSSPPPSAMASSPPVAPSPLVIRQASSTPSLTVPTEASGPLPVAASLLFTAQQQQAARAASASSPVPQPPSTPPSVSSSSTPPSISSTPPPPPLPVSTASPSAAAAAAAAESEAPWPRMALSPAPATSPACSPALPHNAHDAECSTPLDRGASPSSTAVALPAAANNYVQGDMDTTFVIPPEPPTVTTAPVPLVDVAATGGHLGHAIGMGPTTPVTLTTTTTSGPPVSPGLAPQPSTLLFDPAELAPWLELNLFDADTAALLNDPARAPPPVTTPGPQQHHPWAWPGATPTPAGESARKTPLAGTPGSSALLTAKEQQYFDQFLNWMATGLTPAATGADTNPLDAALSLASPAAAAADHSPAIAAPAYEPARTTAGVPPLPLTPLSLDLRARDTSLSGGDRAPSPWSASPAVAAVRARTRTASVSTPTLAQRRNLAGLHIDLDPLSASAAPPTLVASPMAADQGVTQLFAMTANGMVPLQIPHEAVAAALAAAAAQGGSAQGPPPPGTVAVQLVAPPPHQMPQVQQEPMVGFLRGIGPAVMPTAPMATTAMWPAAPNRVAAAAGPGASLPKLPTPVTAVASAVAVAAPHQAMATIPPPTTPSTPATPSSGSKKRKARDSDPGKRAHHMETEKKRRTTIRQGFQSLVDLVPALRATAEKLGPVPPRPTHEDDDEDNHGGHTVSKATILMKSVEYLRRVERQVARYAARVADLEVRAGLRPLEAAGAVDIAARGLDPAGGFRAPF
ncbi:hypothetical protein GGF31_004829 [Allomyces arbusculus]|nr:hypothetical protein GGF31_004829 [Allomyces arbusculus]